MDTAEPCPLGFASSQLQAMMPHVQAAGNCTACLFTPGFISYFSFLNQIWFYPPPIFLSHQHLPRLVHWREWCSLSSPPSLPLAPCLLCAAVNNSAPAVAAFPPLLEELLWETPKVAAFEVAGLQGIVPAGLLFSCLPGSPFQALRALLWAEGGPLISKRVQRVIGAAGDTAPRWSKMLQESR